MQNQLLKGFIAALFSLFLLPVMGMASSNAAGTLPAFEDSSRVRALYDQGLSLHRKDQYDSAQVFLEKAVSQAQTLDRKSSRLKIRILNAYSENLRQLDAYEEALKNAQTSRELNAGSYPGLWLQSSATMALVKMKEGNYQAGLDTLNNVADSLISKSGPMALGRFHNIRGQLLDYLGDYETALSAYQKTLSFYREHEGQVSNTKLSSLYNNLGITHRKLGNSEQALQFYEKDLALQKRSGSGYWIENAITYNNMGSIYYQRGDYGQALDYFKNSLRSMERAPHPPQERISALYNNIGILHYQLEEYSQSLEYLEEALQIKLDYLEPDHPDLATAYLNLGAIYTESGKKEKALERYREAAEIREKTLGSNHPDMVSIYDAMGELAMDQKEYDKSETYYRQALDIQLRSLGAKHPASAYLHYKLGVIHDKKAEYSLALDRFNKGLAILIPGYSSDQPLEIDQNNIHVSPRILDMLEAKGKTLKTYYLVSRDLKWLEEAVNTFSSASRYLDYLQQAYWNQDSKLELANRSHKLHGQAIDAAVMLAQVTGKQRYKEEAYYFAEQSRYRILEELTLESEAKQFSGIPHDLLEKERNIRSSISSFNQRLASAQTPGAAIDSSKVRVYEDSLFHYNQQLKRLIESFEQEYPRYFSLKYDKTTVSVDELQSQWLESDQALIEYFKGEKQVYAFVITQTAVDIVKLGPPQTIDDALSKFREAISSAQKKPFTSTAHHLFRLLLEPVKSALNKQKWIIVPDGNLSYLPFEALLRKSAGQVNPDDPFFYSRLPYVLKKHAVSYAFSGFLYKHQVAQQQQRDEDAATSFLAFAPAFTDSADLTKSASQPFASRNFTITPLPLSEFEVTSIGDIFKDSGGFWSWFRSQPVDLHIRSEASEENLNKLALEDYTHLHFASHAFIDERNPAQSGILLSDWNKQINENTGNGILEVRELYNLELNAELVTLSACQTGMGPIVKGEGIMGLTRPLIYAGATSVLVSLWQVADRSTAELMISFYEQHLSGVKMAEALQAAKIQMIEENTTSAPKYWAPFILIGPQ